MCSTFATNGVSRSGEDQWQRVLHIGRCKGRRWTLHRQSNWFIKYRTMICYPLSLAIVCNCSNPLSYKAVGGSVKSTSANVRRYHLETAEDLWERIYGSRPRSL